MSTTVTTASRVPNNLRFRRTFGRIKKIIDIPNLIDIQKRSYEEFLQKDVAPEARKDQGLQAVFKSVFPIKDFNETASLEFVSYTLSEPKYDVEECHQRGMTFAAPLKVTVQLVIWDVDPESGVRSIKNVKEQEVYFGEIPLMTRHGTFMINGTERVIVSQLHRSPGVFFDHDKGKTHASGKLLYSARIIPYRGSWIDFEFDPKDILYVRIDRRRKFHATILLRALGMTAEDLLNYFYRKDTIVLDGRKAAKRFVPDHLVGVKATRDLRNPQSNELIVKEGRKFTRAALRVMEQAGIEQIPIALEEVLGRVAARDVKDPPTRSSSSSASAASTRWRSSSSTTPTSAPRSATRSSRTRSRSPRTRSSRSTAASVRAIRPPRRPPPPSSTTSSSTPSATTSRAWDASS